ncbi:MAG TPA: hypothetical protein VE972_07895 [Conexibacter sp.]|nr:hypothetical protein [Conexibacter sp.]
MPAVAAVITIGALAPATAAAAPGDHFTCRASAVRVTGLAGVGASAAEPVVANAANDPCAADSASAASAPAAVASVLSTGGEQAATSVDATSASATADVTNPSVLAPVLGGVQFDELSATAGYTCAGGAPVAQSSSQVTGLTAPGQSPLTTSQSQQLHFAGLADVTLNETTSTATSTTQRAATLTLLPILLGGVQIVLGEASVGFVGNPCPVVPPPPSDPGSGPSSDPAPAPSPAPPAAHVATLPPGCIAMRHHGWFIRAGSAALGAHRQVVFHATTRSGEGTIRLVTSAAPGVLRHVAYRLDGRVIARARRVVLRSATLDTTHVHRLEVMLDGGGRRARIVRSFRFADYTSIACSGRRVVGRIAPRAVRVGGGSVRVHAIVPREVRGTAKLRFVVVPGHRHLLRGARFRLDGRPVRQHERNLALTAGQLKASGTQVLTVRLVPRHGRAVTVRISFRTRRT